jgi:hypothetical protein
LDANGTKHNVNNLGVQRWRTRPRFMFNKDVFIEAEADLMTGQIFGDKESNDAGLNLAAVGNRQAFSEPTATDLRQLYLSWKLPFGLLRLGQQTSNYGLGLVANNGDDEAHDVFDDPNMGDLVERVLFATKPLKAFMSGDFANAFIVGGGFDVVFRDDNANLMDGDLAMQGVASIMYRSNPLTVGIYTAFRTQEDEDGDTLDAQAFDLFVKWKLPFEEMRAVLTLAAEVAFVKADTTRVRMEQAKDGVTVEGLGAAFQANFELLDLGLETRFEVGYATGDNNRNDSTVRQFKFDPGYHVGMIIFQEVMARVSANTVTLASDPTISGQPPKGIELVATDGSISNAIYVNPVLRWRSNFGLNVDLGVLAAWTAADFVDPWMSALNGGYNFTYLGRDASKSHFLGTEIDVGLSYTYNAGNSASIRAGVMGGYFMPGGAFKAPEGGSSLGNVAKIRTVFDVAW